MRTHDINDLIGIGAEVILIDAAYKFRCWSKMGEGRSPQAHYKCANYDELAAFPLARIAGRNCRLFSWTPNPHMPVAEPLMRAWGFEYSGSGFFWVKTNRTKPGYAMGGGLAGTRKNVEVAWEGRRGSPKRVGKGVLELIVAPRRKHSQKPDEQYALIERLVGPGKILVELFARGSGPPAHWHAAGDQLDLTPAPIVNSAGR
jgi:N6-adenosine-specific RNA methylase IME4